MRVVFVGRRRIVWRRLLLYILTFGISRRIWLHRVLKEVDGHEALEINHKGMVALLFLPIIGPTIVQARFAKEAGVMMHDSGFDLHSAFYWFSWVPILGNLLFIGMAQKKLNGFWEDQLARPDGGVEIDYDLHEDPQFLVEFQKALPESYNAGSRFDRKKRARKARWHARRAKYQGVGEERQLMREAGGSTSIFPWIKPKSARMAQLGLTCGRCAHKFQVIRDPYAETPILCPSCGMHEVLPALRGNPLARPERAAITTVEADCPKCERHFHAIKSVTSDTVLQCPDCHHTETLPLAS